VNDICIIFYPFATKAVANPPANMGVLLQYHGIRSSKLALDVVVSGLFGVSSPLSPEVALRSAERTKFEKYSEGVRSRHGIRFTPFAVTEFGTLGGHAPPLVGSIVVVLR
jgi:hypothetical protein